MIEPKIFLDMDGVLVNWTHGLLKALGLEQVESFVYNEWRDDCFDIRILLDLSHDQVTQVVNNHHWWTNLRLLPWAEDLINRCCELVGEENVYILSSPGKWSEAWTGKFLFIQRYLNDWNLKERVILTRHKELIAGPGILLDDKESMCDKINNQSGSLEALLFPAPWNSRKNVWKDGDVFNFIELQLELALQNLREL